MNAYVRACELCCADIPLSPLLRTDAGFVGRVDKDAKTLQQEQREIFYGANEKVLAPKVTRER